MLEPTELDKFSCWDCTFCFVAVVLLNIGVLGFYSPQSCLQLTQTLRGWLLIRVPRAFEVLGGAFT